ncbi:pyruvate dehydrogenase (acetyl-transferring) kinase, mitochondrial [Folsomia candida]|uniref:pyruvate dehydrogenase (acetyl-transferring) kinase, mitochondrial n=1 Tax=Folsomia candida TaxID=158441 RepID=UPI000B8FAC24|nr:pyruvate dehydrogenase (acetyl-transferring) kinase, mitochondrial [Folsomia candida]XP_021967435.1 pyruvate dehydrogenase (acetyl-transferring) kinase, mitochondrial [Folsomia candida]XP_035701536.1 pyruvate dehydrogenase (acetyl-transferring) kinase, mitochondrial [Folsomia candida]
MRVTGVLQKLGKMLDFYSGFNPSPLSMKQFLDFGQKAVENRSYVFLRKELPVRLANIMKEINLLPEKLQSMPSVALVEKWYEMSFEEILEFENTPENDAQTLKRFCETLVKIRNRHLDVVQTMAQGVVELKDSHRVDSAMELSIQYFLDRFYMSRISIRMLINQHTLLFGKESNSISHRHIGSIDPHCKVIDVIHDAYENARFLCEQYYLVAPSLVVREHNSIANGEPIKIVYVPSHLYHMVFELFKNSLRAVVEFHGTERTVYPPVEARVVLGKEDISISIADRGGGIPRRNTDLLFQYMYSTAPQPPAAESHSAPLAGYGYGLPLSRLYARYFQGDLIVTSFEGYGTDAIIYLKALSNEANEKLPIFNKTSSKRYSNSVPAADWSSGTATMTSRGNNNGPMSTRQGWSDSKPDDSDDGPPPDQDKK